MDSLAKRLKPLFRQYKMIALAVALGIALMLLPTGKQDPVPEPEILQPSHDLSAELEDILSRVKGVGKVRVMLTQESGERYDYARDEERTHSDTVSDVRNQIVVISGSDRGQEALVEQSHSPRYRGAIIVCQGGDLSSVRLAVVEAVANATGLTTDKITVLKMK